MTDDSAHENDSEWSWQSIGSLAEARRVMMVRRAWRDAGRALCKEPATGTDEAIDMREWKKDRGPKPPASGRNANSSREAQTGSTRCVADPFPRTVRTREALVGQAPGI